jgi:hypothetical protein
MSSRQCLLTERHSGSRRFRLPFSQVCSPAQASQASRVSKSFKKLAVRPLFVFSNHSLIQGLRTKDGLANLEVMLHVVGSFGEHLPPSCRGTCQEVWPVFDAFLVRHGSDYDSAEHVTRVLRHALNLFGEAVLPIAADILGRMSASFASSGLSCYLWIASKVHGRFGNEEDPLLRDAIRDVYERSTQKLLAMLREKSAAMLPDGEHLQLFPTVLRADW